MKKPFIFLSAISLLFFFSVGIVKAETQKVVTLGADQVINKDYFATGEVVEISGTVNGDVYAAGGEVRVDGIINGDLLVGGGVVNISGKVSQDVRVGGGQVAITGTIGRNLTIVAGNVEITNSAKIIGNLVAGAGNINLRAPIGGDVTVGAGNLVISSNITGDLEAGVGTMRLTSTAKVGGDITYWSEETASIDDAAKITGDTTQKEPPEAFKSIDPTDQKALQRNLFGLTVGAKLFGKLISFISLLIVGLLIIRFCPKFMKTTTSTIKVKPWASIGLGFVVLVTTPIAIIVLLVTLVGIPLGLFLLAAYLAFLYLAKIFVAYWAGSAILEKTGKKAGNGWILTLGLIIYMAITLLPRIGGLITFIVTLIGLGSLLITKKQIHKAHPKIKATA